MIIGDTAPRARVPKQTFGFPSTGEPKNDTPFTNPVFGGPSNVTNPGFTPDYSNAILNDPSYQALKNSLSATGVQNAGQRAQATQQALIQFGMVPDFAQAAGKLGLSQDQLGFLSQDVTPDITALANQNTQNGFSTEAQLSRANDLATLHLRNALAASGALSSGEANWQTNNQQHAYGQQQNDALNALLSAIGGYQNSYLTAEQTRQQQLAQALADATARQQALPQNQPTAPTTYNYNPSTGQYEGSGGTWTPQQTPTGYVVVNDATGDVHELGPDGTVGQRVPTVNAGAVDMAGKAGKVVGF